MEHNTAPELMSDQTMPATSGTDSGEKKVFVKTYGCQMNVYDSQRMADALAADGYRPTDVIEDADLVLLNTCHIREKAAEKVYSELGRIRQLKEERARDGRETVIGVAGCVAQAEGREILRRAPVVDLVIGPQTYHRLPAVVGRARGGEKIVETEYAIEDKFAHLPAPERKAVRGRGVTAFLTVQEGCDKFCSFCVVPYTRGAEWSRPVDQITAEVRALAAKGIREVTLLGQNVNAFHGEPPAGREADGPWTLGKLLRHLAMIGGIDRIRYTTSHPRDMDEDLIAAHRDVPEVMPYLHLPVQAGSDKILKAMNRKHSFAEYEELIGRIREARPDIAISGDFIVGFPGETDKDFEATMEGVRRVNYASAFSFKYSRRPGTPGAALPDQVDDAVATERLHALQALLEDQQRAFNLSQIGKTLPVLFEKPGREPGQLHGRSPYLQSVHCDAPEQLIGQIVEVRVEAATRSSLSGVLAGGKADAA